MNLAPLAYWSPASTFIAMPPHCAITWQIWYLNGLQFWWFMIVLILTGHLSPLFLLSSFSPVIHTLLGGFGIFLLVVFFFFPSWVSIILFNFLFCFPFSHLRFLCLDTCPSVHFWVVLPPLLYFCYASWKPLRHLPFSYIRHWYLIFPFFA